MFDPHNPTVWNLAETWKHFGEPARPSASEVNIVDGKIRPGMKVLLLGSTPEYRDILVKKNCCVVIVDYNEDNFKAMSSLMTEKPLKETFIKENWLNMRFLSQRFDLIIGDHVINLLPVAEWNNFLETVHLLLNPNGSFLQRVIARPEPYNNSLGNVFKGTWHLDGYVLFSKTFYDLMFMAFDAEKQTSSLNQIWSLIAQARSLNLISESQFSHYQSLSFKDSPVAASVTTRNFLMSLLEKFYRANTIISGDIFYKDYTFFILSES